MRSWASRGARSPGSARKRSSCSRSPLRRDGGMRRLSTAVPAGLQWGGAVALRRQHGAARVGRRGDGAAIGPGLEIVERVDDAPAELAISGARAVGAMLLESPDGEDEEIGSLRGR